jgi:hypothetical protein
MTQRQVTIDETDCSVHVVKTGSSTWRAYGDFRGKHIQVTGRSESDAFDKWRSRANSTANE